MAGGGGNQNSTVYQSNLPKYAEPYYREMMDRTLGESERPYQTYQGQRLAGQSSDTQQGLNMSRNFANSSLGAVQNAQNMAMTGGIAGLNFMSQGTPTINNSYTGPQQGAYQAGNFNPNMVGFQGSQVNGQNVLPGVNQVTSENFGQAQLDQYSSPYMQAVVDKAKMDATGNAMNEQQYRNSQAAAAGAFGGSRAAVQQQMATKDLMSNLTNIDVQGRQSAFENAQQQFERDRAAGMNAQQANQQAGMNMALANQRAGLDAAQLGEQSRQFGYGATEDAYKSAAQLGMTAQQATEQFRQSGAELGSNMLNQAAQNITNTQGAMDDMTLNRIKSQLGVGQTNEQYSQQQMDMAYNDFINQRDVERQNLQFLSSILRGVPISANQNVVSSQGSNPLAGMLGSASGLQALYQLGNQQ